MSLGMKVGLGPGHIVLDGGSTQLPPQKGGGAGTYPIFGLSIVANGWMDQDATW